MSARPGTGPEAGLCAGCRHGRRQESARGSRFWRCGRAERDPRFSRYPALPVRACGGFEASPGPAGGAREGAEDSGDPSA